MLLYLSTFFKGLAMGAANVIPGVSGGTIAFITGIYERLVGALSKVNKEGIGLLLKGKLLDFARHIDLWFLLTLGFGAITAIVSLAGLLEWAFAAYPQRVWALFFGLILASIWPVLKMVKSWSPRVIAFLLVGLGLAVGLAFLSPAQENDNPFYLGLCGVVAACSMILPGVSGSFVLVLMGNYELVMIEGVNSLRDGQWAQALQIMIPVGIGAVVGLLALAKLLNWLFKRFHDYAVALVGGFVSGSLVSIWPWKVADEVKTFVKEDGEVKEEILSYQYQLPEFGSAETWWAIGMIVIGVILAYGIDRWGEWEKRREGILIAHK